MLNNIMQFMIINMHFKTRARLTHIGGRLRKTVITLAGSRHKAMIHKLPSDLDIFATAITAYTHF
jgi:hypothetical protein